MTEILYTLIGAVLCATIGALGAVLYYRPKLRRHQRDAWRQARLFYVHGGKDPQPRL